MSKAEGAKAPEGKADSAGTNGKSANALRTISEVADSLELPQHVLRFWESKFPQLQPVKRSGGRRYYRPEDIATLQTIQRMLHEEGYTIKGALSALENQPKPTQPNKKSEINVATIVASIPKLPLLPATEEIPAAPFIADNNRLQQLCTEIEILRDMLLEVC